MAYQENQKIKIITNPTSKDNVPGYGIPIMYRDAAGKAKFVSEENPLPGSGGSGGSSSASAGGNSILVGKDIGSYIFNANAKTITFNGLGALSLGQIQSIVNLTDNTTIYSPTNSATGGFISSNVLTLNYDTTSMNNTDELQIYVYFVNSEDYNLNVEKTIDQSPLWSRYTNPEPLVSNSVIGVSDATYIDQGNEISVAGYNNLGLYVSFTANNSITNTIKLLVKYENDGTDEFILETSGDYIKTLGNANINIFYSFAVDNLVKYVQVQSAAGTVGATAGTLSITITKGWK